jgi:hypothetical protein
MKEAEVGYYQAGDATTMGTGTGPGGIHNVVSPNVTYITPARQKQIDAGKGYDQAGPRRRINPGNVRALRRSMRRLHAFEKLARRVITFTKPHAGRKFKLGGNRKRR